MSDAELKHAIRTVWSHGPIYILWCAERARAINRYFFELSASATRQRELCVDDVRILS